MNQEVIDILKALGTSVELESGFDDLEELLKEVGADVEHGEIAEVLKEIKEIESSI